jgi:NAD-dependent deacetylase
MEHSLECIARWITEVKTVVIFTGAGLSTESGIPDFRSPGGVWDKYNPEDFYFDNFLASEISRWKYWQMATEMYEPMKKAQPNAAHLAIAELEKMGKLDCVITQNIDNLHVRAGNSPDKVIELHGTAMSVSCLNCRKKFDREKVQERLRKEMQLPYCDSCGGPLKPETISFGQAMPVKETQEAYERAAASDLFIVIGSSLVVQPAASMPVTAKRNGARLVIINRDPTPCDSMADIVLHEQAGPTMTALLNCVKTISAG